MFGFSAKPAEAPAETMKDQVRRWNKELRQQVREIERNQRQIERDMDKLKREIQTVAKKGDQVIVKTLCTQLVKSRAAVNRLASTKAQINSVAMQLETQAAFAKVSTTLGKSADIMKTMNTLLKAPEVAATARTMAMEMQKAGLIEEVMNDAMDSIESPELEDEANEELEGIMYEITQGMMGKAPDAPLGTSGLPTAAKVATGAGAAAAPARMAVAAGGAGDDGLGDLHSRLGKL